MVFMHKFNNWDLLYIDTIELKFYFTFFRSIRFKYLLNSFLIVPVTEYVHPYFVLNLFM